MLCTRSSTSWQCRCEAASATCAAAAAASRAQHEFRWSCARCMKVEVVGSKRKKREERVMSVPRWPLAVTRGAVRDSGKRVLSTQQAQQRSISAGRISRRRQSEDSQHIRACGAGVLGPSVSLLSIARITAFFSKGFYTFLDFFGFGRSLGRDLIVLALRARTVSLKFATGAAFCPRNQPAVASPADSSALGSWLQSSAWPPQARRQPWRWAIQSLRW